MRTNVAGMDCGCLFQLMINNRTLVSSFDLIRMITALSIYSIRRRRDMCRKSYILQEWFFNMGNSIKLSLFRETTTNRPRYPC